ncbi:hypothetical protein [Jannaschia formosa]|uniref:hypothetical protein n=1 Tax=Jannaschia formosa TaxID=2259592 RepID=UPI001075546F|nr:hypothetical protein [Jannaschia formosa]TFL15952.1 hypothetical protein DR046_22655 [Jannaschia formosa]
MAAIAPLVLVAARGSMQLAIAEGSLAVDCCGAAFRNGSLAPARGSSPRRTNDLHCGHREQNGGSRLVKKRVRRDRRTPPAEPGA